MHIPAVPGAAREYMPALIRPKNAEILTGTSHEYVIDTARRLGVPILGLGGRKRCVEARAYLEALAAEARELGRRGLDSASPPVESDAEALRRELGMARRGGER